MPASKQATKAGNNILSKEETVSLCTHLAKAVENICGSVTSLPKNDIAILASQLEATAIKLRGFCRDQPETSSKEWAESLNISVSEEAKKARVFRQSMEEIQVAYDRSSVLSTLNEKTLDATQAIIGKARTDIVKVLRQ